MFVFAGQDGSGGAKCWRDAARLAAVCAGRARRRGRQPRRQAPLRRPALQLQQAGATCSQHHRCPQGLHQAQVVAAHRRGQFNFKSFLESGNTSFPREC